LQFRPDPKAGLNDAHDILDKPSRGIDQPPWKVACITLGGAGITERHDYKSYVRALAFAFQKFVRQHGFNKAVKRGPASGTVDYLR